MTKIFSKYLLIILISLTSIGCSTIFTKRIINDSDEPINTQGETGHPYSGTQLNLGVISCMSKTAFSGKATIETKDDEDKYPILGGFFVLLMMTPAVIDLPLSFIADTLYLPVDLYVEPEHKKSYPNMLIKYCYKDYSPLNEEE